MSTTGIFTLVYFAFLLSNSFLQLDVHFSDTKSFTYKQGIQFCHIHRHHHNKYLTSRIIEADAGGGEEAASLGVCVAVEKNIIVLSRDFYRSALVSINPGTHFSQVTPLTWNKNAQEAVAASALVVMVPTVATGTCVYTVIKCDGLK